MNRPKDLDLDLQTQSHDAEEFTITTAYDKHTAAVEATYAKVDKSRKNNQVEGEYAYARTLGPPEQQHQTPGMLYAEVGPVDGKKLPKMDPSLNGDGYCEVMTDGKGMPIVLDQVPWGLP